MRITYIRHWKGDRIKRIEVMNSLADPIAIYEDRRGVIYREMRGQETSISKKKLEPLIRDLFLGEPLEKFSRKYGKSVFGRETELHIEDRRYGSN